MTRGNKAREETQLQKQKHSVTGETKWLVPHTFAQAPEGRAQALVSSQYTVGNTQPSQRGPKWPRKSVGVGEGASQSRVGRGGSPARGGR